jgi:iron(III) transport system substrate-binding protein
MHGQPTSPRLTRRGMLCLIGLGGVAALGVACSQASSSAPASGPVQPTAARPAAGQTPPAGGAASDWNTIVAAAKQEGKLVLSTHAGSGYEKYVEAVKKALPDLSVEATTIKASDFAPRVIVEQQNGQFLWDVHMGPSSNMFTVVAPAGGLELIKPYLASLQPDVRDDSKWAGGFELFTDPNNPVTFISQLSANPGIFVNKDGLPEGLATPDDLMNPKLKGQIAVYDPTNSNAGAFALADIVSKKGDDFLKTLLNDQQVQYVATSRQLTDWVAQGRYPVCMGVDQTQLQELQNQGVGKNVESVTTFGTTVLASGVDVLKNPPHPNATRVYLNWALSQAGQEAWATLSAVWATSRRLDVKVNLDSPTAPDYTNMGQYTVIQGTASADAILSRTLAITRAK